MRTYISVKDAWKLYGYKEQYLRRLLRQKKLSGIKIGQTWLIEVPSLKNYLFLFNQTEDSDLERRQEVVPAFKRFLDRLSEVWRYFLTTVTLQRFPVAKTPFGLL